MTEQELHVTTEQNEKKLVVLRAVTRWALYSAFLVSTATFFYIGPRIDAALFPVVGKFEITKIIPKSNGVTQIKGVMFKPKSKEHCDWVQTTFTTTNHRDPAKIVQLEFEPDDVRDTRPPGSQEFGPWTLFKPDPPIGPFVTVWSTHRCHLLWNVRSELYSGLTRDFFPQNAEEIETLED